jgi:endonuclease/exonuclease/phosphatase family metal-dependent hydrolase
MSRCFLVLLLLTLFLKVHAGDPDTCKCKTSQNDTSDIAPLKILSWNIYLLPMYAFETQAKYKRAHGIADELSKLKYDIIVFQEAFHSAARGVIARHLHDKYPYQYGPCNDYKTSIRFSSGVWIISRIPLKNRHEIRYKRCKGTDALARKGAMLLEGCWHGQPFQIVGTHLQADTPYDLRQKQLIQLKNQLLIPCEKEGVPQFICGDMNTCYKNCDEYKDMLTILEAEDEAFPDGNIGTSSSGEVIDYVLVSNHNPSILKIARNIMTITHQWSTQKNWLSDHRAVEATIFFGKKTKKGIR